MAKLRRFLLVGLLLISFLMTQLVFAQDDGRPQAPPQGANLPITDLIYEADFTDDVTWLSAESDDGTIAFTRSDTGYTLASLNPDMGVAAARPLNLVMDNFYTEMEFTVDTCLVPESALLFFARVTPNTTTLSEADAYVFVIQCNGEYRARPFSLGTPGEITSTGQTLQLEEGQTYSMGILISGSTVAWYLSGTEVARFEAVDLPTEGWITPGVQRGMTFTMTEWRTWELKASGTNTVDSGNNPPPATDTPDTTTTTSEDPLNAAPLGTAFFDPGFNPPTPLQLGLTHPVAAYVSGNNLIAYNTEPFAIMQFADINQSDYFLEIAFVARACVDTASIGFAWHADDAYQSYNALQVQCDGGFHFYQVTDGQAGPDLLSGTINPPLSEFDRGLAIGLYVQGERAWLYVEGEVMTELTGSSLNSGHAGMILASGSDGSKMDVLLFDIVGYELQ